MNRTYLCIDLKSFYASVECVERGLDPFKVNLVVADPTRGNGAITLAITPALKALGVKNRCRLFEIPKHIKYDIAMPRMRKYIDYSANIYAIYLKYVAKEDIHPYSIDEMFLDVTNYLKVRGKTAKDLAKEILNDILATTGVTATVGIGTNLYLAKIALDITAKHSKDNIGYLDEEAYKEKLWHHKPLTDFWQVGEGIAKRLAKHGIIDMYGVAHADEKLLYKEFGINAEYLIDHAKGSEPTTIEDIKCYKPKAHSLSQGQVLHEDYTYDKALIVVKEMVDSLSLELIDKHLVAGSIGLNISYSKDIYPATGGSRKMHLTTNVFSALEQEMTMLYKSTTRKDMPIRKINISFGNLIDADFEQLDLLTDRGKIEKERTTQKAMNQIKTKFGKNVIMRGMNLQEGATQKTRNKLIGGHRGGEENK
jgi:DNA polymerase V